MWRLKLIGIVVCIAVILFGIERFWISYERFSLFGWWFMHGESQQGIMPVSKRVDESEIEAFKQEIANMLQHSEANSRSQSVALAFAEEFQTDPEIEEQLIIVAHDHPDEMVRCRWQKRLKSGHNLVIITGTDANKSESIFPIEKKPCVDIKR